jgi:hypothetical protein
MAHAALARAEQLAHPQTLAFVQAWVPVTLELCGLDESRSLAEASLASAKQFDFPMVAFFAEGVLGWILARSANSTGIDLIRQSMQFQRQVGIRLWFPLMATWLAEGLLRAGDVRGALSAVADGIDVARSTGVRISDAELHGLRGEALARQALSAESAAERAAMIVECEQALAQSSTIAREQGAKSLELRGAIRAARLLSGTPAATRAYRALSAVYDSFSEGFDTPDLIDARRLLDAGRGAGPQERH